MVEGEVRCITSRWDKLELTMTSSQVSSCDNPFSRVHTYYYNSTAFDVVLISRLAITLPTADWHMEVFD